VRAQVLAARSPLSCSQHPHLPPTAQNPISCRFGLPTASRSHAFTASASCARFGPVLPLNISPQSPLCTLHCAVSFPAFTVLVHSQPGVLFPALTQIPPAFTSIHFWLDLSLLLCLRPAAAAVCAAVHLSSASALPILPQRPIGRLRQVRRPLIGRQHTQTCLSSTERSSLARPVSRATV
jgi:hypothetical protein